MGGTSRDAHQRSFSLLARRLGCPRGATPDEEVAFLRAVDAGAIQGCLRAYDDSDAEPKLCFRPQVDHAVVFSPDGYADRARRGEFAKVVSRCFNEARPCSLASESVLRA